jgi:adenylosuccinate synthase
VGEAVEDSLSNFQGCVRAGDLSNPPTLRRKLNSIRERKRAQLAELFGDQLQEEGIAREWDLFEREDVIDTWISTISRISELGLVAPDTVLQGWLRQAETVIFEGAQGVLLDAEAGFHPFTTWSRCTPANALEIIKEMAPGSQVFKIGVLRSYAVRHGPGPLPTETGALSPLVSEHNQTNTWQGAVRYGWFDAVLARYALGVAGGVDSLMVTHLDLLPRLPNWQFCPGYQGPLDFNLAHFDSKLAEGVLVNFHLPPSLPLAQREQFTRALAKVTPVLESCEAEGEKVIQKIESLLGQSVDMISSGPRAENVQIIKPRIYSLYPP